MFKIGLAVVLSASTACAQFFSPDPVRSVAVDARVVVDGELDREAFSNDVLDHTGTTALIGEASVGEHIARAEVVVDSVFERPLIACDIAIVVERSSPEAEGVSTRAEASGGFSAIFNVAAATCARLRVRSQGDAGTSSFFLGTFNDTIIEGEARDIDRFVVLERTDHWFQTVRTHSAGDDPDGTASSTHRFELRAVASACDFVEPFGTDVLDVLEFVDIWLDAVGMTVDAGNGADFDADGVVAVGDVLAFVSCWLGSDDGCE